MEIARRFEPVLHFTHGEMFFPMPVAEYLRDAALWKIGEQDSPPLLLVEHGNLHPEALSEMALEAPGNVAVPAVRPGVASAA